MANFALALKEEVARITRKEIKKALQPFAESHASLHRLLRELEAKLSVSAPDILSSLPKKRGRKPNILKAAPDVRSQGPESSSSIKALRKKLGISQESLAFLLGISGQAVFAMEKRNGVLRLRKATLAKLAVVRQMDKSEAQNIALSLRAKTKGKPQGQKRGRKKSKK